MVLRFFVMANTAPLSAPVYCDHREILFAGSEEIIAMFNYLTNSSGFTRITAYVGQSLDGADGHIDELSRSCVQIRPPED